MLCTIISQEKIASGIYDMRADLRPEDEPFPGQFMHVAAPGALLRRPISLCGFEDGVARLVYAVRGEGTRALSALGPGERIDALGPLGRGFEPGEDRVLLVGGGVGLPPLLFFQKRHRGETRAVAGFRTAALAMLTDELRSVDVMTDDGSTGERGYPHERARELLSREKFDRVLACGPTPMLKAVAAVSREAGVPCFVSLEERMGCGVGACLVCACSVGGHYRRVCADGPVFRAEEVDWT